MGWSGKRQRSDDAGVGVHAPPGRVLGVPGDEAAKRAAGARFVGKLQPIYTNPDESGTGWWNSAACAGMGPALFFPDGEKIEIAAQDLQRAKAVCAGCPVRTACLEFALATRQDYGVWGGTSESERYRLRRACRTAGDIGVSVSRSLHPTGTVLPLPARGQGQAG